MKRKTLAAISKQSTLQRSIPQSNKNVFKRRLRQQELIDATFFGAVFAVQCTEDLLKIQISRQLYMERLRLPDSKLSICVQVLPNEFHGLLLVLLRAMCQIELKKVPRPILEEEAMECIREWQTIYF